MRVLVACEFSGIVRDAFIAHGHDAWSCDVLPSERPGPHHQCDVLTVLSDRWDLMIAHPPCTFLCNSGVRWLYGGKGTIRDLARWHKMEQAAKFFKELLDADVPRIAVENPVMHSHAIKIIGRRHDQLIQPHQFGHPETKANCFWLKNLPPLKHTNRVSGRNPRVHYASPSKDRWKERSRTLQGIADAMTDQWGSHDSDSRRESRTRYALSPGR